MRQVFGKGLIVVTKQIRADQRRIQNTLDKGIEARRRDPRHRIEQGGLIIKAGAGQAGKGPAQLPKREFALSVLESADKAINRLIQRLLIRVNPEPRQRRGQQFRLLIGKTGDGKAQAFIEAEAETHPCDAGFIDQRRLLQAV